MLVSTLEAMMYGCPTQETKEKRFNDSVFGRKDKKVNDLVAKFEKNMKLEESTVEIKEDKNSEGAEEAPQATKSKSWIPSMEDFVEGILRTSSPIPQAPPTVELQKTPILPYHPVRRDLDIH